MSNIPSENPDNQKEERSTGFTISRRAFLGISATTAAALAAAYAIKWPGFDFGPDPMDSTEGVLSEKWVMTSCLNCPTRCATKVRVVNGKAVRIIGNNISEYSNGKTCPRSHIGLQVLYNPERITKPLKRKTGVSKGKNEDLSWEDQWEEISWEAALQEVAGRLNNTSADELLIIQGLNTTSDEDLIYRFAKSFGASNLLREDTLENEANNKGKELANISVNSGYDLKNASYVLSFGADILESETPLSRHLNLWGYIRQARPNRARVVVIDPRYSVTASKADEWIPINPGTEGLMAMAVAHVIIDEGLYNTDFINDHTNEFNSYSAEALKSEYSPDNIAAKTGVSADVIRRIAREFASDKPAIAWSGAGASSWPHGSNASYAIMCLNALVGSIDVEGGVIGQDLPQYTDIPLVGDDPQILSLREAKESLNDIHTVVGFNNNLIMSVPNTRAWDNALANDGYYYVHIASSHSEMAQYADIILPSCSFLEEWGYETSPPGSIKTEVKIKQPVLAPMEDSKPTAQIIFDLVDRIAGTVASRFGKDNIIDSSGVLSDPEGFVKYRTSNLASLSWTEFKSEGVWKDPDDYKYGNYNQVFRSGPKKFMFDANNLKAGVLNSEFQGSNSDEALVLTTYHPVMDVRSGNQNYPWAQEVFLVMHGRGWNNFVEMNEEDADERGIKDGDTVKVKSDFGEIKIKARVFQGIKPGAVAIALGQGHYQSGEWADDIGRNPNEIMGSAYDELSGQPCFMNTRVEID